MTRGPDTNRLLRATRDGDGQALDRLTPPVYAELRRLAEAQMRSERGGHTLQPTALVHEAFLRLVDQSAVTNADRGSFIGLASHIMRQVLVDHARRRGAQKRGGDRQRITLGAADRGREQDSIDLLDLEDALRRLDELDQRKARLVELRFYGGMSVEDAATFLDVSISTAEGDWRVARAWLRRELAHEEPDET